MRELKLRHFLKYVSTIIIVATYFFIGTEGFASPILVPADSLTEHGWFFDIQGQSVKKEPVIKISDVNDIQVPITSGSATIFSGSHVEIETEGESEAIVAQFGFKPRQGLYYLFRLGQVQKYEMEFSSGAHTNKLDSLDDGWVWGFGIGGRIVPASVVSVGAAWQIDYNRSRINLDRFQSPGVVTASQIQYTEEEIQGSVNFSYRWEMLRPYGGLKIMHTVATLTDKGTKSRIRGEVDGVSPFVGVEWSLADRETVTVEASLMEEKSISAAMKIQF